MATRYQRGNQKPELEGQATQWQRHQRVNQKPNLNLQNKIVGKTITKYM
jgi:hypothetical protein